MVDKCKKYYERVGKTCKKTNFGKLSQIRDEHQHKKIGKFLVGVQTAKVILEVHKNLKKENKEKFKRIINSDIRKARSIAWRMV